MSGRRWKRPPNAEFWLHQFKLMEGVDDPDFVAVALFDPPGNARQLIQQIGRVVRLSAGRIKKQTAAVLVTEEDAAKVERTLERYRQHEEYCAEETRHIVANEIALPDRVLERMPLSQYIDGQFRKRFDVNAALSMEDLQLSTSAAVFEWDGPRRALDNLLDGIEDSIADQDRFRIVPIAGLPADSAGFTYYAWRNSPLLIDKFFSEWTLGLFIAIQNGEFVMMHDTEGLVLDTSGLSLKAASRRRMELAFPEASNARPSRLTRMSFASLDMSSQAIRTMSMRTRSFETTFTDLLDPHLVPTAAAGFVNRRARYIGFARARFRDSNPRVGLQSYIDWTRQVAGQLRANAKASPVFGRYAKLRDDIDEDGAQPASNSVGCSRRMGSGKCLAERVRFELTTRLPAC
jgi:hypothetical protein